MSYLLDQEKSWLQRDFGLDKRLIKALSKLGFTFPTLIQSKCIPIALQGKDILVRARTGSGKTVAFGLPVLHKVLTAKAADQRSQKISAIILAPSKELCKQIEKHLIELVYYCKDVITIYCLSDETASIQQYRLQAKPDIVVTTPAKLVQNLKSGFIDISQTQTLVIDEADLVLSYGYSDDVQVITSKMPKIFQGLLMSATLSPELEKFKKVILHTPAIIKLEESKNVGHLLQYYLQSTEGDKYLILYVFIKLGLLQGRGLIFVNDVTKGYKLKLFLQQFFIPAAVLNSELPVNSRMHILEEFNKGIFDYLIATDDSVDEGENEDEDEDEDGDDDNDGGGGDGSGGGKEGQVGGGDEESGEDDENGSDNMLEDEESEGDDDEEQDEDEVMSDELNSTDEEGEGEQDGEEGDMDNDSGGEQSPAVDNRKSNKEVEPKKKTNSGAKPNNSAGYGVARGIDFQGVSFVINFDFPQTSSSYTHRIGRTARGGASGTALSFVCIDAKADDSLPTDTEVLSEVRDQQPRLGDNTDNENVLASINVGVNFEDSSRAQPGPLMFNTKELDSFRYRVEDTLRSVTGSSIRDYRSAELKKEMLNSTKLKSFFASNPNDLKVLRHDVAVAHPIRQKEHLKHVPDYLIPASMRTVASNRNNKKKKRKLTQQGSASQDKRRQISKSRDPLLNAEGDLNDGDGEVDQRLQKESTSYDDDGDGDMEEDGTDDNNDKIFTNSELGSSTSGRKRWQMQHHKGKFSKKSLSKQKSTFRPNKGRK